MTWKGVGKVINIVLLIAIVILMPLLIRLAIEKPSLRNVSPILILLVVGAKTILRMTGWRGRISQARSAGM
ncbi:hypothetical protein [Nitrospirillum iridis]|uniref:Uncharacterized protein n=1 Tax=Nitrospirillum iridis TaxID=765888 RepID=A0A7X0EDD0_9PROT|nr:hypothetical protein [Nitrospirillum iridis]MBB6250906.1 hypothetical protein [Nitrospirillum iridis]